MALNMPIFSEKRSKMGIGVISGVSTESLSNARFIFSQNVIDIATTVRIYSLRGESSCRGINCSKISSTRIAADKRLMVRIPGVVFLGARRGITGGGPGGVDDRVNGGGGPGGVDGGSVGLRF